MRAEEKDGDKFKSHAFSYTAYNRANGNFHASHKGFNKNVMTNKCYVDLCHFNLCSLNITCKTYISYFKT